VANRAGVIYRSSEVRNESTTFDALIALALGLGSFALYLTTLAPTVLFGDGGEFQFVPYVLGIAHPTGYPLYLLLGWAWSHILPIGEVAFRMNLLSAVWAALTVGLSYLVALRFVRLGAPGIDSLTTHLSAVTAALTFAVSETFWSQAIIAEIYSFNAFFVALILLLSFWLADCLLAEEPQGQIPPGPGRLSPLALRSLILAFCFGLSLTHHRTMLLLLPGVLVFLWLTQRSRRPQKPSPINPYETRRIAAPKTKPLSLLAPRSLLRRVTFALVLMIAFVIPLLLYLYLPLRAPNAPYATLQLSGSQALILYENSWRGFVDHLTASVFANNLALPTAGIDRLMMVWELLRNQIGLVGIGLALVGLGRLIAGRRWSLFALSGLGYVLGVAFNLGYFIGDVQVLFIPSYLFVSLWLGLGVASIAQGLAQRLVRWKGSLAVYSGFGQQGHRRLTEGVFQVTAQAVTLLALSLPVVLLVLNFSVLDQSTNTEARDVWESILARPIPEGSVLISNDRDEMMPLWYYQLVEGRRPDLLGLFPLIVTEPTYANVGGLLDQVLSSQRPAYLVKPMPGLEVKAQLEPDSDLPPLVRVSGPAVERPPLHPREIALAGVMRLVGYDQSPSSARPGDTITITIYWQPQAEIEPNYSSYVHLVDEAGRGITQSDHQAGGDYYPTSLWRPGEVLRDSHLLSLPADVEPGVYRLIAGMYRYPSLEPLGGPADIGLLAVKNPDSVQMEFPTDAQSSTGALTITDVEFGDRIMLLGYDVELVEDNELGLVLYWQAERPLDQNWTVFVHVVDGAGALVTQLDSQPRDGRYPTSVWDPGEVVDDSLTLTLPLDLLEGEYQVILGLYSVESGERLPVLDGEGNPVGDSIPVTVLTLTDGQWHAN
jgi:hypothetical protein